MELRHNSLNLPRWGEPSQSVRDSARAAQLLPEVAPRMGPWAQLYARTPPTTTLNYASTTQPTPDIKTLNL